MSETTNVSIRMDVDLKKQAEELFSDLGLNMTVAMKEAERIAHDPDVKGYTNLEELFRSLKA